MELARGKKKNVSKINDASSVGRSSAELHRLLLIIWGVRDVLKVPWTELYAHGKVMMAVLLLL